MSDEYGHASFGAWMAFAVFVVVVAWAVSKSLSEVWDLVANL